MRRSSLRALILPLASAGVLCACSAAPPKHFTEPHAPDRFTPCSSAPHCVSSQAKPGSSHHVPPFQYTGSTAHARDVLLQTLRASAGASVKRADGQFIHATFTSHLMGFVDDVTFIIHPQQNIIDVKSSSRIGYYDFGVNRRRVKRLRARFASLLQDASVSS